MQPIDSDANSGSGIRARLGMEDGTSGRGKHVWKKILWGIVAFIMILMVLWGLYASKKQAPLSFKTQPVIQDNLVVTVTATGNLASTSEVEVGSELSGIIKTVTVDYNDRVQKGQPLAYLDSTKFEASVMKSRAVLISAKAAMREAQATLREKELALSRNQKARKLTDGKIPSIDVMEAVKAETERARAAVDSAKASIQQAEADLKANETDFEKTVIYSPIDGIVLDRSVEPGQTVAASLQAPVLFTLAGDLAHMELQVDVDEADVGGIHEGQQATFTVDAYPERNFEADITQVRYGSETTDNVVTYKTILNLENPDLLLRPGMTATADIIVQKMENVLLLPNAALRFTPPQKKEEKDSRGLIGKLFPGPPRRSRTVPATKTNHGKKQVWIYQNNQLEPVPVATGLSDGIHTVIHDSRLRAGMEVVVDATGEIR